jgi:hypothetical protein
LDPIAGALCPTIVTRDPVETNYIANSSRVETI